MSTHKKGASRYLVGNPKAYGAIIAAALFFVLNFFNYYHTRRTGHYFVLFAWITCVLECIGYICRCIMTYHPLRGIYIASQCLLVITPVFTTLVNYIVVGRLLARGDFTKDPLIRFMHPAWIARIFTFSDFFCLILQGAGASMLVGNTAKQISRGLKILRAGLFIQIGIFTIFAILALLVYISPVFNYRKNRDFRPLFIVLGITIVLIQVRTIFRVVEFLMGADSYIETHEAFLYCCDFALIFICCILFTFVHYGDYLNIPVSEDSASTNEVVNGAEKDDGLAVELVSDNQGNFTKSNQVRASGK
uniref:Uncharacterized protein n=1 Tax=Polytomella parva TaxID=51329 RepID=A0A6U0TCI6_9CHLO|mmetsp:Transcript_12307/g.22036  ORF Transcript_12307/g.22036 Transcript_12307/m.22036 type:complete len:305 (+) Transcript_12307:151-1065(+)